MPTIKQYRGLYDSRYLQTVTSPLTLPILAAGNFLTNNGVTLQWGVVPEVDPVFTAWLAVPPNVSVFTNDAGYLTVEVDPVFTAWLAVPPNVSVFTNDAGYLTVEVDPVHTAWLPTYNAHDHSAADPTQVSHANLTNVTSDQHHAQVHTIASHDTTATGAELTTVADGVAAKNAHTHTHLSTTGRTATDHHDNSNDVKAWVFFTTTTVHNSFNVSSITSYGTGTYGINFTNAMPNTSYCITGSAGGNVTYSCIVSPYLRYTTYVRVRTTTHAGSWTNPPDVNIAIFGD